MIKDRLAELKVRYTAVNGTVETPDKLEKAEVVTTFLLKVDAIGRSIDEIEANIQKVKANQLRILSAPGGDQKANTDLDMLMREMKALSLRTRADLKCSLLLFHAFD
ncbi:hypothetical protein AAHC03_01068 [Spirometra sp. Aus1]